ncbi:hypothetical protein [Pseudomonas sp. SST3]|nr:hypothetical protein [Pseudomonas sp. SST3]
MGVCFWLVPLFTTAVAVGWIIELAEHYPMPAVETDKVVADPQP